ncbi:BZ3500_MvSof-1268-A1-R1_Chr1-2g01421 [Microbotryum saponariae]|uniref:BZ3500_MvSof-1268-A1-R1_Chr1-2g01421 protein n=1 Tax=Microbotryum saponariae TaxID=289078 RepID=A0A2X0KFZ9_9BASI|nr:BZ3500_MvSof-1268-A1-R1_Chr1-2g01421 [Microbotryum saponariae]SCZ97387.1 BZ3501_MvSof-1269-A2-R1_Chr1-2g01020 [Microbotryum saponariae]
MGTLACHIESHSRVSDSQLSENSFCADDENHASSPCLPLSPPVSPHIDRRLSLVRRCGMPAAFPPAFEFLTGLSTWLHPNLFIRPATSPGDVHGSDDVTGVSIWSTAAIDVGQTVACIPKRSVLSHRNSQLHLPDWNRTLDLSPTLRLVLVVLYELHLGPQSIWSEYLASLASATVPVGVLWTGKAKVWARGTQVARVVRELGLDHETIRQFYDGLPAKVLGAIGNPTREAFFRAYSLVSSRAVSIPNSPPHFYRPQHRPLDTFLPQFMIDAFHTVALVPLFDLFNHSDTPHVHPEAEHWVCSTCGSFGFCSHDDQDEGYELSEGASLSSPTSHPTAREEDETYDLVTVLHIDPSNGEQEIFNTYGDMSNAQLVTMYGFLIDGNQYDRIHFEVGLKKEQRREWEELISLWSELGHRHEEQSHELIIPLPPTTNSTIGPNHSTHEEFYIDAEARLSTPLWLALLIQSEIPLPRSSRKKQKVFLQSFYDSLSATAFSLGPLAKRNLGLFKSHVETIVRRIVGVQHRPESTSRDLFDLAETDGLEEMERLAIKSLALERGLLETLVAKLADLV